MKGLKFHALRTVTLTFSAGIALFMACVWLLANPNMPMVTAGNHKLGTGGNGDHGGKTGPEYEPATIANFGGYVWGAVFSNNVPLLNTVVTLSFGTKDITATTLLIAQSEPYPIFMFGTSPLQIGAYYGSWVTMSAILNNQTITKVIQLIPHKDNELEVPFAFGDRSPILPMPSQAQLPFTPTQGLTDVVPNRLLSVGNNSTCVVVNGAAKCWGRNDFYFQLGDGTLESRNVPTNVLGLSSGVRSIAIGGNHACAAMQTGKVLCWGWGYYGALGPLITPKGGCCTGTPIELAGINNAVDVVVGELFSCALLVDGTVKCWGRNTEGEIGNGVFPPHNGNDDLEGVYTTSQVLEPNGLPLTGVSAISAQVYRVCAVISGGGAKCWGSAPLGNGTSENSAFAETILPVGSGIVGIDTGYAGTCLVKTDGTVWCWGDIPASYTLTPTLISTLPPRAIKVAVGNGFACALLNDGKVKCWGNSNLGQTGIVATKPITQPIDLPGINGDIADLSAGDTHTCARTVEGRVFCWGYNYYGQLGDGSAPLRPATVPATVTVVPNGIDQISVGGYPNFKQYTCAKTADGKAKCWGANDVGQLGIGTFSGLIKDATEVLSLTNVLTIITGWEHSCAIVQGGTIWCWGLGNFGQLGDGSLVGSTYPVSVTGITSGAVELSLGRHHTCARFIDGSMKCWGNNGYGQLGNGTLINSSVPVDVISHSLGVRTISAGGYFSCAVLNDGSTQCWGANNGYQLGSPMGEVISVPVSVKGLTSGVTSISSGSLADNANSAYSCAIQNGAVLCWGSLSFQPITGSITLPNFIPVTVTGWTTGVVEIKAGSGTLCATLASGVAQCLGYAETIGAGHTRLQGSSTSPITVTGLTSNVASISTGAGALSVCAVLQDKTARCWGYDESNQLGTGYNFVRPTPAEVPGLKPAEWTYMLYLVGDNDLGDYLDNIARALDTLPITETINIAILFDGPGKDDTYIWTTKRVNGYNFGLNKWNLAEDKTDLGNPKTLAQFIDWAHVSYPAKRYYLALADHGRATSGTGWDTQSGTFESALKLTPAGIRAALREGTSQGAWKINILHFDSCLMGLLETAYQVKDYANYMIASQNLTAAFYPYDQYAQIVLQNPNIQPRELAIAIANTYFDYDYLSINHQPRTISVWDLSKVGAVSTALNVLATTLNNTLSTSKDVISVTRALVQTFDASEPYFQITPDDVYVDLYHWVQLIKSNSNDPIVIAQANSLSEAISGTVGLVIHNRVESGYDVLVTGNYFTLTNSNGAGIFFPRQPQPLATDYRGYFSGTLFAFTGESQWDELLQGYYAATNAVPTTTVDSAVPPVLKPTIPITTHCGNNERCIWGAVYSAGLPLQNIAVTLQVGTLKLSGAPEVAVKSETYPIFVLSLGSVLLREGDLITISTPYSGGIISRTVRFAPVNEEQEINITLPLPLSTMTDTSQVAPAPSLTKTEVTVIQAFAYPTEVQKGGQGVALHAEATSNNGTDVVRYEWRSDKDGTLGTSASVVLPSARLSTGKHTLTITAYSSDGVASQPITLSLTVNDPATPTPTATPTPNPAVVLALLDGFGTPGSSGNRVALSLDNQSRNTTQIDAAQIVITYDNTRGITLTGVATTTRTQDFQMLLTTDRNNPSHATLLIYSFGKHITSGIGPIADLFFEVSPSAQAGVSTTLAFVKVDLSDANGNPVPSEATDTGTFSVGQTYPTGDINGDNAVNVLDLQRLISMITHAPQPDAALYSLDQWSRADLNRDGNWNVFDLQQLINIIIGKPAGAQSSKRFISQSKSVSVGGSNTNTISLPNLVASPGSSGSISVNLSNEDAVSSGQVAVVYDPRMGLRFTNARVADRTSNFSVNLGQTVSDSAHTTATLLLYNLGGLTIAPGSGPVILLDYTLVPTATGDTALNLAQVLLADSSGTSLPAVGKSGWVSVAFDNPTMTPTHSPTPTPTDVDTLPTSTSTPIPSLTPSVMIASPTTTPQPPTDVASPTMTATPAFRIQLYFPLMMR